MPLPHPNKQGTHSLSGREFLVFQSGGPEKMTNRDSIRSKLFEEGGEVWRGGGGGV